MRAGSAFATIAGCRAAPGTQSVAGEIPLGTSRPRGRAPDPVRCRARDAVPRPARRARSFKPPMPAPFLSSDAAGARPRAGRTPPPASPSWPSSPSWHWPGWRPPPCSSSSRHPARGVPRRADPAAGQVMPAGRGLRLSLVSLVLAGLTLGLVAFGGATIVQQGRDLGQTVAAQAGAVRDKLQATASTCPRSCRRRAAADRIPGPRTRVTRPTTRPVRPTRSRAASRASPPGR